MNFEQPKPDSKKYSDLIRDIEKGVIKIPKFQRDFVWSVDKTAKLLDSILKGYPIGTFILWQTDERINDIKNVGNLDIPPTPDGTKVQYVLDGQQRITSLFAAYRGATIQKVGEKKITDYSEIDVNLNVDVTDNDEQVITAEPIGENTRSPRAVLNFSDKATATGPSSATSCSSSIPTQPPLIRTSSRRWSCEKTTLNPRSKSSPESTPAARR